MNPDTKDPAIVSRGGWYLRLFLFTYIPAATAIANSIMAGKPWHDPLTLILASIAGATGMLGFINKSTPEDTQAQKERKRDDALTSQADAVNNPPPPMKVKIEQPPGESVPTIETPQSQQPAAGRARETP